MSPCKGYQGARQAEREAEEAANMQREEQKKDDEQLRQQARLAQVFSRDRSVL